MQEKSRTTKRPPLIVDCTLCGGRFQRAAWCGPAPDHCMRSNVERSSECWSNQPDGSLLKTCAESLRSRKPSGNEMTHFISLLAGLGHAHDQSEAKVQEYLADLLPEERHILLKRASAELSIYLAKQISLLPSIEIRVPLKDRSIPEELPEVRGKLNAYKKNSKGATTYSQRKVTLVLKSMLPEHWEGRYASRITFMPMESSIGMR